MGRGSYVGRDVFTQTAGVHADGDRKGDLYASRLTPERFGRKRSYALGKLSGRASLEQNLDELGIALSADERARLLARVVELGDRKQRVDASDLWFLINDVLGHAERPRVIRDYAVNVQRGEPAHATIELECHGRRECQRIRERRLLSTARSTARSRRQARPRAAGAQRLPRPHRRRLRQQRAGRNGDHPSKRKPGPTTLVGVDADQIGAAVVATEKLLQLLLK